RPERYMTDAVAPVQSGPPTDFLAGLPGLGQYVALTVLGHAIGVAAELRLADLLSDSLREAFGERSTRALGGMLESVRTGESAISRLYGESIFQSWQSDPDAFARTNESFRNSATVIGAALVDKLRSVPRHVCRGRRRQ